MKWFSLCFILLLQSSLSLSSFSNHYPSPRVKSYSTKQNAREAIEANVSDETLPLNYNNYHLIVSRGNWEKMVLSTAILSILHQTIPKLSRYRLLIPSQLSFIFSDMLLPLLASACCVLQLLLNLLAVGCAGFNTLLGPTRPFFIGLLAYLTIYYPATHWMVHVVRWSTALLPEGLHLYNTYHRSSQILTEDTKKDSMLLVTLDIPTMGCVACVHSVNAALENIPTITVTSPATLYATKKGGTATVVINGSSKKEVEQTVQSLMERLKSVGFPGSQVISLEQTSRESEK